MTQHRKKAIAYMIFWAFCFVSAMSLNKLVDKSIPTQVVVFYKLCIGFFWFLPFIIKKWRTIYKTNVIHLHIIRSFFIISTMGCTYYAYRHLPLAIATSIGFSGPLFASLLAALVLKERLTLKKLGLILFGYTGVLIVAGPHCIDPVFYNAILVAILGNILIAFAIVLLKALTKTDSAQTILFYNTIFTIFLCGLYAFPDLIPPPQNDLYLLLGIGVLGFSLQFAYAKAIGFDEASFVAPLEYMRILIALPIGYFFFHEIVEWQDIFGALCIIVATFALAQYNNSKP